MKNDNISPYLNENKLERSIQELEGFLINDLDVKSYSELVLIFETLKDVWQRDNTHQEILEGRHLEYADE